MRKVEIEERDTRLMALALEEAEACLGRGEVPVGALLADSGGAVIAAAGNRQNELDEITAHAEIEVIRKSASVLGSYRLEGCVLYSTSEPCVMCMGAIAHARISRVVFGSYEPKFGFISCLGGSHRRIMLREIDYTPGVLAERSVALLRTFFQNKRGK